MKVTVYIYNKYKHSSDAKIVAVTVYEDVISIEIKLISAEDILAEGFDSPDPHGEYLILTSANGERSTFRNSYCDEYRDISLDELSRCLNIAKYRVHKSEV